MGNGSSRRAVQLATKRYGGGTGGGTTPQVSITYRNEASRTVLQRLFGRPVSDRETAALAGAPPGSQVTVRGLSNSALLTTTRSGPDAITAQVSITHEPDGTPTLGQQQADYARPLTRARALAAQVQTARALGVERIGAKVHGGLAAGNWSLMPQLGYDAPVARVRHELHVGRDFEAPQAPIPPQLHGAVTYYDLWRGDPAWLASVVLNPDLTFDTRAGSVSTQRLAAYLRSQRRAAKP